MAPIGSRAIVSVVLFATFPILASHRDSTQTRRVEAPPVSIDTKKAAELRIAAVKTFPYSSRFRFSNSGDRLFTVSGTRLARVIDLARQITVVEKEIPTYTNLEVEDAAWAPDDKRILIVARHGWTYILDITSKAVIELGQTSVGSGGLVWANETQVYRLAGQRSSVFDLDTLSSRPFSLSRLEASTFEAKVRPPSRVSNAAVELLVMSWQCGAVASTSCRGIGVADKDGWFWRFLSELSFDDVAFSPTAKYAVLARAQEATLEVLTLGPANPVPLGAQIIMGSLPGAVDSAEVEAIAAAIDAGRPVFAEVFSAKINPLNSKVIGPEGPRKGTVRILAVKAESMVGRVVNMGAAAISVGDVVDRFRLGGTRTGWTSVRGTIGSQSVTPEWPRYPDNFDRRSPGEVVQALLGSFIDGRRTDFDAAFSASALERVKGGLGAIRCEGTVEGCFRRDYRDAGALQGTLVRTIADDGVKAEVELYSEWKTPTGLVGRTQRFWLSLASSGWLIDTFDSASRGSVY